MDGLDAEAGQQEVVEALTSGDLTGSATRLTRIDTHMSLVFLSADHAYKLKRARRHPFADLSTLEARRRACEAEIAVNRRLAPHLYEGVRPIMRAPDGSLRIGGPGPAIEWLVVMRRFTGGTFENLAIAGELTSQLIEEAAQQIADFHKGLKPRLDAGTPESYVAILEGLRLTCANGPRPPPADAETLLRALGAEIGLRGRLIDARRAQGWVRRGHGDLHLRNICRFEGRVTPFDALEFDPKLATADVLYDLAFLLMDLQSVSLPDFTNRVLNAYWDATRQPEDALALVALFMSLRAAVRMAVAVEGGEDQAARRYLELGLRLLKPSHGPILLLGGLSGSGKSTVAKAIAPHLAGPAGGRILRSDVLRKAAVGVETHVRLPDASYAPEARRAVYRELANRALAVAQTGASLVVDATFQEGWARRCVEQRLKGRRWSGIWLRASVTERLSRVGARGGDASDATLEVARTQTEPASLGAGWRVIDADRDVASVAHDLLDQLGADLERLPAQD